MDFFELDDHLLARYSYGIIDPLDVDLETLRHLPLVSLAPSAYVDNADNAPHLPYLLPLKDLSLEQRQDLLVILSTRLQAGESSLFCMLLEIDHPTVTVVGHLRSLLVAKPLGDIKPQQLRYHDPRVLIQLSWILDANQIATLLGPAKSFAGPHANGARWFCLSQLSSTMLAPRLKLTWDQWCQVKRIGSINVVLTRYQATLDQIPALSIRIDALLAAAETVGLLDEDSAVEFALHGLRSHPNFYLHPHIAGFLVQSAGHPQRYQRLTANLTDIDWQDIVVAMQKHRTLSTSKGYER